MLYMVVDLPSLLLSIIKTSKSESDGGWYMDIKIKKHMHILQKNSNFRYTDFKNCATDSFA